jgi:hypothetical protein
MSWRRGRSIQLRRQVNRCIAAKYTAPCADEVIE